ncbi:hypothetical protein BDW02DRAFT_503088 [Decorospora gaudefroyi]|uniref:BTB domain-containing protein n=1 Tax=Decorospora gaudefroyi TaxID=184978 RepID=A0A6A5K7D2_9PLEO|nr:hypothetical protein BDW02DRAFT_503088 [Decorospora gaudefroyi]
MSISDNSTVAASRDHDGMDGYAYGVGDLSVSPEERSPYANAQMISLEIGTKAVRFRVHDTVLSRSDVFAAKLASWDFISAKPPIPLPELDEATAHTLVHYLYTGKYQSLNAQASSDKAIPESYKLGAGVYCAAVRYKLPGLAELAKEQITSFDDDVTIFDILAVARDHAFPLLPEEDAWYPTYIEGALNHAMTANPEPFRKPDFVTQIEGNSKLLQVVWKTVMSNYVRAPVTPVAEDDEAVTPIIAVLPEVSESIESGALEPSTNPHHVLADEVEPVNEAIAVLAAADNTADAPSADVTADIETTQEISLELEGIEPTLEAPATPEPFTDELGFGQSKTYQRMGKQSEQVGVGNGSTGEPMVPVHIRSDSVMQVENVVVKPEAEAIASIDAELAKDGDIMINETKDAAIRLKKSKKKKGKSRLLE